MFFWKQRVALLWPYILNHLDLMMFLLVCFGIFNWNPILPIYDIYEDSSTIPSAHQAWLEISALVPRIFPHLETFTSFTLWLFNIAMETMAHRNRWFSQPLKPPFMVGIFHGYVSHNQRVYGKTPWRWENPSSHWPSKDVSTSLDGAAVRWPGRRLGWNRYVVPVVPPGGF